MKAYNFIVRLIYHFTGSIFLSDKQITDMLINKIRKGGGRSAQM